MMSILSSIIGSIISIIKWIFSFIFRLEERRKKDRFMIADELDKLAILYKDLIQAVDGEGNVSDDRYIELTRICERNCNRWDEIIDSGAYYGLSREISNSIEVALHVVHYAPGSIIYGLNEVKLSIENKKLDSGRIRHLKDSIDKLENISVRLRLND